MKKNKFPIGFWNYVESGKLDAEEAAGDWQKLGMTIAMSFEYDSAVHAPREMTDALQACLKRDISVIVCDRRTHWRTLTQLGEEAFRQGVIEAEAEFGAHPAVFAFHVGDEPNKNELPDMVRAYRTVKELTARGGFVNFYPAWAYDDFQSLMGVPHYAYGELLSSAVSEAGIDILSYDCYTQMYERNRDEGLNAYFGNLNLFRRTAETNGIPMWTSLLSVGHWCYRVPTEDDLRWQISTAVAHGAEGLLWFYLYDRTLDSSYRMAPFDVFYEKTETFARLSRQNRIFNTYFAQKLQGLKLVCVRHFLRQYGGTPIFLNGADEYIVKLESVQYEPLAVSRFENRETGEISHLIVNLSRQNSTRVKVVFREDYRACDHDGWLAPGQMILLEKASGGNGNG